MLLRNVLIFHTGALGDFVLSWPLALALGRVYAQSRIIYITHAQKGALAERVLRLESRDIETGWHALFAADAANLPPRNSSLLSGAHAVYTFLPPTPEWSSSVNRLSPQAKVVAVQSRPGDDYGAHASDWLVEQLQEHPVERAATQQILRSIAERGVGYSRGSDKQGEITIHPGSGSPAKCWPFENYIELAHALVRRERRVRWLVGEVERERWPSWHFEALAAVGQVHQPATYVDLLAELSTASAFIGNDSGPGHLAGIIGSPTFTIFGPTSPAQWKPLGPRVRALQGNDSGAVSLAAVVDAVLS
jgi:ADP-heptose:LPS heptosyltransferase